MLGENPAHLIFLFVAQFEPLDHEFQLALGPHPSRAIRPISCRLRDGRNSHRHTQNHHGQKQFAAPNVCIHR